jgi:hypothetical protein
MSRPRDRVPSAFAKCCIPLVFVSLAMLSTIATTATAQGPWTVEIEPSTTPLVTGGCTPIRLTLLDASGKDAPRNPTGMRVSISDFDMTVAPAGAVVGRYDGAAS